MDTRNAELKKRLAKREVTLGAWMSIPSPTVAEVMAGVGFDWIIFDAEHTPLSPEALQGVLMGFTGRTTVPLIRVAWNDPVRIKQVLDMGAEGVVIPFVSSVEEARRAVNACKYPPMGTRGHGPRRASDYYRRWAEYVRTANESIIVVIQIEHVDGVKAVDQILAVPGIDVVMLGPMDLSGSLGLLGQVDHPAVIEAIERVIAAANRAGIAVGVPMEESPAVLMSWLDRGCQFISLGEDHSLMNRAATGAITECRQVLEERRAARVRVEYANDRHHHLPPSV